MPSLRPANDGSSGAPVRIDARPAGRQQRVPSETYPWPTPSPPVREDADTFLHAASERRRVEFRADQLEAGAAAARFTARWNRSARLDRRRPDSRARSPSVRRRYRAEVRAIARITPFPCSYAWPRAPSQRAYSREEGRRVQPRIEKISTYVARLPTKSAVRSSGRSARVRSQPGWAHVAPCRGCREIDQRATTSAKGRSAPAA